VAPDAPYRLRRRSYAQEGEDLLLDAIQNGKRDGFYIDIGCHHPFRLSNTYLFYTRGWRGIVIDPNDDLIRLYRRHRPRDLALCRAIARERGEMTYYRFKESAFNTLDADNCQRVLSSGQSIMLAPRQVAACPFSDIQNEFLAPGQRVNLLSIDVEGCDLDVLKSADWSRFAPDLIVAEEHTKETALWADVSDIQQFLESKGYRCRARIRRSAVFFRCGGDGAGVPA
jgi:FkbM family methyltransferase